MSEPEASAPGASGANACGSDYPSSEAAPIKETPMSSSFALRAVICCLVSLGLVSGSWGAPTPQEITKAVKQLGSKNFRQRKQASDFLWAAGKAAEAALQKAAKSKDAEIARRAREILEKFKYGIYPDTPKQVLGLIKEYRTGNDETKVKVINELNKLGAPGHAVLIKFAAVEEEGYIRRTLFHCLTGEVIPGLLTNSRFDEVEELLELGLKGREEQALRDYAAYLALRGRLDARLPVWNKKAKKLTGYKEAEVATYLYRAKGDLKSALGFARRAEKKWLPAAIQIEQSDWKELAASQDPPSDNPDPLVALSYKATFQRLAGNIKDFEKTVAELLKSNFTDPYSVKRVAFTLLLNDRAKQAIDLLVKNNQTALAFTLLATQNRYREAFALADKVKANHDPEDLFALKLAQARTHIVLGDRERAVKLLAKLADEKLIPKAETPAFVEFKQVVETEYQLDLKDQAFAHCAQIIPQAEKAETLPELLGKVFPDQGSQAAVWWRFFRKKHDGEKSWATLQRMRALFAHKVAAKDFAGLAKDLDKAASDLGDKEERDKWLLALGEMCRAYGQPALAQTSWEKAASADALLQLGHLAADKKQWLEAAKHYGKAWAKDQGQPLPLYLQGWALVQAGRKQEGEKWLDLARTIPLANDKKRFQFSVDLAQRGFPEAATREREFLLRTGQFNYLPISNTLTYLSGATYLKKDYRLASIYHDRSLLPFLEYVVFVRTEAYLRVPALGHLMRAQALIQQNKIDNALKEVRLGLASLPGDLETVLYLFPELEKRKRKKEAEEIFKPVFAHFEKVCKDYPKSAQNHNSLAWLAVCCRRQLDKALEHAKKAVDLEPKRAGYLDTLAEVYYQRGDKAQAVKLMKQCIALEPKSAYYKKQIKRFEAAGPPSPTPRTPES
jgi:tetratricopeptide (TPR) repeat protein